MLAQADAISSASKPAVTAADADKAKAAMDDAKGAAGKAQTEVDRLEKEIADKNQQAQQIYAKTDADFAAADSLKGNAAIDAGTKAMADRKQGDALTQQAAELMPS